MYAEILLQDPVTQNEIHKAIALYENDLKFNPNRFQAIVGLARAEAKLGNKAKATYWYKKLMTQFDKGDGSVYIQEAKQYLLKN
jgi:hypothetical protein